MKKLMMFVPLVVAAMFTGTAAGQMRRDVPRFVRVQYGPPVATHTCTFNGVAYPVDQYENIWGRNAYGRWVVIGRIVCGPNGCFAVMADGERIPTFGC